MNFKKTVREQIISAVIDKLSEVNTTNGYNTNCGSNVVRARKYIDPDELPVFVVWPQTEEAKREYGQICCTMQIKIEGLKRFKSTNPSVIAEQILGDMINVMTGKSMTAHTISDFIEDIEYSSGGTEDYPDKGEVVVSAFAVFTIKYSFVTGDPYSQKLEE